MTYFRSQYITMGRDYQYQEVQKINGLILSVKNKAAQ